MIKGNELRIGNWCFHDDDPKPRQYVPVIEWGKWFEFEQLNPIPLTEEWLLKFECVKIEEMNCWRNYQTNGVFELDIDESTFWFENHWGLEKIQIQYVHQLQNLYFALTGAELTWKT